MAESEAKTGGGRSPAYPYIDLQKAVQRTREAYQYGKRSEANIAGLYKHWGFSGATGSSKKTLAALKYYGLLDQVYGSQNVKLSNRAIRIVLDHDESAERAQAILDAFLGPKMYGYMWEHYGSEMPHDDAVRSHLLFEKGFNESTVDDFIQGYKRSKLYSKIDNSDTLDGEGDSGEVNFGDWVQWESQGQLMFPVARQVVGFSDDGEFAFVEGSEAAVPISEIEIVDAPEQLKPPPPPHPGVTQQIPPVLEGKMRQDTFSLDEGQVLIQFPGDLSPESFEDLTDWLILQHRKIGRSVDADAKPKLDRSSD